MLILQLELCLLLFSLSAHLPGGGIGLSFDSCSLAAHRIRDYIRFGKDWASSSLHGLGLIAGISIQLTGEWVHRSPGSGEGGA